jgi:hypothetical protein
MTMLLTVMPELRLRRHIFVMLNDKYSKYYTPSKHLAVDKVIVLLKVQVIFKLYIPEKYK